MLVFTVPADRCTIFTIPGVLMCVLCLVTVTVPAGLMCYVYLPCGTDVLCLLFLRDLPSLVWADVLVFTACPCGLMYDMYHPS